MTSPRSSSDELELISRQVPAGVQARQTPLLFIHGAYTAAWCWEENFLDDFASQGYASHALSLSGHGGSRGRGRLDSFSIDDYVEDVRETIATLPAPPVLIGHSMGGFVVQKYLERHTSPAAVLLCSVPPQGLMSSMFGLMFQKPGLLGDLNRLMTGKRVSTDTLREALFHQTMAGEDLLRYLRQAQGESNRAIWDMTLFNLPHPSRITRTPLLVLGAEHDALIPVSQVRMTAMTYGVKEEIFSGMGHGLMLEPGWAVVASRIREWLLEQGL